MRKPFQNRRDHITSAAEQRSDEYRTQGKEYKIYPCSPSSWTLSHRFSMSSQFSLVKFSSVVFTAMVKYGYGLISSLVKLQANLIPEV